MHRCSPDRQVLIIYDLFFLSKEEKNREEETVVCLLNGVQYASLKKLYCYYSIVRVNTRKMNKTEIFFLRVGFSRE